MKFNGATAFNGPGPPTYLAGFQNSHIERARRAVLLGRHIKIAAAGRQGSGAQPPENLKVFALHIYPLKALLAIEDSFQPSVLTT